MIEKLFPLLYPYITYTGDAKVVMDSLIELIEHETDKRVKELHSAQSVVFERERSEHLNTLVALIRSNESLYESIHTEGNIITPIKNLRSVAGCGLKAAKDAVEMVRDQKRKEAARDADVQALREKLMSDPWDDTNGPADCEQ